MWNIETRIEITTAGRQFLQEVRERPTRRPMLLCGICDAPLRGSFDNETGEEYCLCDFCADERCPIPMRISTEEERARFYREDSEARNVSDSRGEVCE